MPRIPLPPHLQGEPFTSRQGLEAGLGRKRMAGRDIQNPFHGTHTTTEVSLIELCKTYATRMPPDAFFCGVTAAGLRRVPLPRHLEVWLPLHVAVPRPRRAPTGRNIAGRSLTVDASELESFGGLLVRGPARMWCENGGIRHLVANLWITTTDGYRYRADLAIPRLKIIIEYHSDLHLTRETFGRDRTRISRLIADGWTVIELTSLDLANPAELVRRIQRVVASRS